MVLHHGIIFRATTSPSMLSNSDLTSSHEIPMAIRSIESAKMIALPCMAILVLSAGCGLLEPDEVVTARGAHLRLGPAEAQRQLVAEARGHDPFKLKVLYEFFTVAQGDLGLDTDIVRNRRLSVLNCRGLSGSSFAVLQMSMVVVNEGTPAASALTGCLLHSPDPWKTCQAGRRLPPCYVDHPEAVDGWVFPKN